MHRTLLRQHSSSMPAGPAGAARSRPATAPPARSPGGPAPQAAAGRPQRASQPPPARRERMTTMHRTTAAAGSAVFFALAPGTLAVLIPWGLTGWHPHHTQAAAWIPFRVLGAALIAAARAQPDIPRRHRPHRRAGTATRAARPALVRRDLRRRHGRLRLRLRTAHAQPALRNRIRPVPPRRTRLVATPPTLAAPLDRRRPRPTPDHDPQLP